MPSGITHILLMKEIQNRLPSGDLKMILASGRDFLQVGAVAPDLPYASIADNDYFFSTESDLADKFHYEKTNEIPLRALSLLKSMKNNRELSELELRFGFTFFVGYISHLVADGIIHPFIRDKVGNYKDNQTDHRKLEMQLDVLLFHHLTANSGASINLNYSNIHDELKNFYEDFYPETPKVINIFSKLINDVYNVSYESIKILGWVKGLHRLFGIAEGNHPQIYKNIGFIRDFIFSDYNDLLTRYDEILTLKKPKDREDNFLKQARIHYFDDILPQFYEKFIPITQQAYSFIYQNEIALNDSKIPQIDLDNGRLLADNGNLDYKPILWS